MKDIPGYEGRYSATTDGRIWSHESNRFRKPVLTKAGYPRVLIRANNQPSKRRQYKLVHRLVALTYIPNPEHKITVNHKDGNPANSRLDNLEWATFSEQLYHSYRVLKRRPCRDWKECNHDLTIVENVYINTGNGKKTCKACAKLYAKQRRLKHKEITS